MICYTYTTLKVGGAMDFNCNDDNIPYTSDAAYEDLEKIREILHGAQREINKDKIKKAPIELSIQIDIDND
jgi:hypothetical protein